MRVSIYLLPIDVRTDAMSTRQDEIRDAIRGFADQIKPAVDPDQASSGPQSVQNGQPPLQQVERGGVHVHVGDALVGNGPVDFNHGPHGHLMPRSEPTGANHGVAFSPNLSLLVVSAILWFCSIATLYFVRYLPEFQSDMLGLLGFLSLIGALISTLLSFLAGKRD
ncbi:MAG: hypothetical protein K9L32_14205 [Chromatiaceae bacterium]|nr:hypothetical protein [Chromatiaceae bacterium]